LKFLYFRNFEQLALALKTEFALKFFKAGRGSPHAPCLVRLWYRGWKHYILYCM